MDVNFGIATQPEEFSSLFNDGLAFLSCRDDVFSLESFDFPDATYSEHSVPEQDMTFMDVDGLGSDQHMDWSCVCGISEAICVQHVNLSEDTRSKMATDSLSQIPANDGYVQAVPCEIQEPYSSQSSPERPAKKSSNRTAISKAAKTSLVAHFSCNPYPDGEELVQLAESTGLSLKTVRTWFVNTRSRKGSHTRKLRNPYIQRGLQNI